MPEDTPLDRPREIYTPFDARETQRLLGFVADVDEFASSSFFQRSGLRASMEVAAANVGTGFNVTTEIDEVAEESVRAVVPIFRQIYSHTEPTSFAQVFNLVAQHVRARPSARQADALAALKEFRQV